MASNRAPEVEVATRMKHGAEMRDSYDVFTEGEEDMESIKNAARVNIALSLTHNLGDGDYIKIHVGIDIPCRPDGDALFEATKRAKVFIKERIKTEYDRARRIHKEL